MKNQNNHRATCSSSRRKFLKTISASAATFAAIPFISKCSGTGSKNISNFGGVQIGAISYSWRSMPDYGPYSLLQYALLSGVGSLEARWLEIEEFAGIPEGPVRRPLPQNYTGGEREEFEASQTAALQAQREWRISTPITKFENFRQMYNAAGVDIHLAKMRPANWSDDEIDYAFRVAKELNSRGVGEEIGLEACHRLAPFAEKHSIPAYFHNHGQVGAPGFSFDDYLRISPMIMLNLDVGHFYGATGINPADVLREYHDRIISLHLKDKTGPSSDPPDTNRPFGQGETPLAECLQLIQREGWPIVCDIELEYPIPEGSDAIQEVRKCVEYCKQALL